MPFLELLYRASTVHRTFLDPREVQQCSARSSPPRPAAAPRTASTVRRWDRSRQASFTPPTE
jgi:hypothetical protein